MSWSPVVQLASDGLSVVLIVRLLILRLQNVYRVFCAFLLFELLASLITFVERAIHNPQLDYRLTWIPLKVIGWILSLWVVYALLQATLTSLPGILKFSRKLLNFTFVLAVLIALWTAKAEYAVSSASSLLTPVGRAVGVTLVLDRAVCTVALLVLIGILGFVVWFPVRIPKNLAVFSFGLLIFFAARTVSLLTWSFWSPESLRVVSDLNMLVPGLCCAYWAIFITGRGEQASVRIGHHWQTREQERLIGQLEAMNASLLRAARR
jgi:hypothetical protein